MTWTEAVNIVKEWDRRHSKDELCIVGSTGAQQLHTSGKRAANRIQKFTAQQAMTAVADVELEQEFPKFKHVMERLEKQGVKREVKSCPWSNGDVIEIEGVVGIISRNDSDDYIMLHIPYRSSAGKLYWTAAPSRIGDGMRLSDADAWEWAREFRCNGPTAPMGMYLWEEQFRKEEGYVKSEEKPSASVDEFDW